MDFLQGSGIWVYLFIFFGKITEVTLATLRYILINRGERKKGSFIAFFEVTLWLFVAGSVLTGFSEDLIKALLYCVAFALGNFLGSYLEGKLALGLSTVQVICDCENYQQIANLLRQHKLAVTSIDGQGREGSKKILFIHLKRSRITEAVKLLNQISEKLVITITDLRVVSGGYIKK
ncbi:MAG: DUF5698 domain-containing protein [Clostridia bacterium]|nr:DUF5698 domain-containing protein [Clostridia bacterium]